MGLGLIELVGDDIGGGGRGRERYHTPNLIAPMTIAEGI